MEEDFLFRHIITTKSPTEWETIRKDAEERMQESLSDFTPFFVHWKDIMLNTADPVNQVTNAALWGKVREILIIGRSHRQILVIEASPEDLDDISAPKNSSDLHGAEVKMKQEIAANSFIYVSYRGGAR
ncbi:hypothetical protein EHV15_35080 [Paenibacillus oralis]|uniref:Uncharacterized protein n=1 Tax=Paenibacillus oralis TaxID=2490856 RepID=A0A3P3T9S4_9BACL|nr:hypothetical protein [Paenibacillus oralis]RRJ54815.1 hypothetical protein EHV15_35080 [Paenibacillus oralis]